jgi:hypothetical protein
MYVRVCLWLQAQQLELQQRETAAKEVALGREQQALAKVGVGGSGGKGREGGMCA